MTDRSKTLEVMRRGMLNAGEWSTFWSEDDARALCRAALTALQASGMAVVPVEPTQAMCLAALRLTRDPNYGHCADTLGRAVYHAMLATHTQEKDA